MTLDELCDTDRFDNFGGKLRFILLKTGEETIEPLEILQEREKSFLVQLADRPHAKAAFWIPKAAFAVQRDNPTYTGIVPMSPWFRRNMLDAEMKRNLRIVTIY
jgi:hypothetical protein